MLASASDYQSANLPEGLLDFNSPSLKWIKTYFYDKPCKITNIPVDRLEDFIRGEEERGQTKFVRHPKTQAVSPTNRALSGSYQACQFQFAKEAHLVILFPAGEGPSGLQPGVIRLLFRSGRLYQQHAFFSARARSHTPPADCGAWQSQKRGCQAHFVATVYHESCEQVNLRYYQEQHVNKLGYICHGPACASAGVHRSHPHLSDDARSLIEISCLLGLPAKDVIQQVGLSVGHWALHHGRQ